MRMVKHIVSHDAASQLCIPVIDEVLRAIKTGGCASIVHA